MLVRGRVFAFEFAMFTLTQSISIFAAGALMDAGLDVRQVTGISALTAVLVIIIWLFFYTANISRVDRIVAADAQLVPRIELRTPKPINPLNEFTIILLVVFPSLNQFLVVQKTANFA